MLKSGSVEIVVIGSIGHADKADMCVFTTHGCISAEIFLIESRVERILNSAYRIRVFGSETVYYLALKDFS
jgi:hypothetical protein